MKWIKDEDFIRGGTPMTKFNIRILTIGYLQIEKNDMLLDIGAGTGSVSIESSLQGAQVWAIERDEEALELIQTNMEKFGADINIIKGHAPRDLPDMKFNKCFIGGSGGKLDDIFHYLDLNLENGGILCGNFILLNNTTKFIELLKKHNYTHIETQLIQASSMDRIGLLKGQNPIFIIKGVKNND